MSTNRTPARAAIRVSAPRAVVHGALLGALAAMPVSGALLAAQDSLQTTDGRFVTGPKMTKKADGSVVVHFENGDVTVRKDLVGEVIATTMEGGQELAPEEKAQLERGLVRYEGRWVKKDEYERQVAKARAEREQRMAEAMAHREWANRYVTETEHFIFEYTLDPEKMRSYADLMEAYYKEFTKFWRIKKPANLGKLTVKFYHDEDAYYQTSGAPYGAIGFFRFVPPEQLNFYYDRLDEPMTVDVMFHETNHYLTHLIDVWFMYPPWVNESLAEYYGASEYDAKTKKMRLGGVQDGRLAYLQDSIVREEWQDLEEMIRLPHGSFNAGHYAWGWSFVHFLLSTPKYEKPFIGFYKALAEDPKIDREPTFMRFKTVPADAQIEALKRYLKLKDLKGLQEEWHGYVKNLRIASHRGYSEGGYFALMRQMPLKAERLYKTAIDMGDTNPTTWVGYSRALHQNDKVEEALKAMENALALDPLNASCYVHAARLRDRLARGGGAPDAAAIAEINRLRGLAQEIAAAVPNGNDYNQIMLELDWEVAGGD